MVCVSVTDADEASREELDMDSAEDHSASSLGGGDEYAAFRCFAEQLLLRTKVPHRLFWILLSLDFLE